MEIIDYEQKIFQHSLMLDSMMEMYTGLMDRLAVLERVVKASSISYLTNNPTSKSALEKVEMLAVKEDPKVGSDYIEIVGLRIVIKALERRMELVEKQMMACQSCMKWNDSRMGVR